jgi:hypothetical protein
MSSPPRPDVLLISLGTTLGWRAADAIFLEQLERAGLRVASAAVGMGSAARLRRAYPVTDVVEAMAARRTLDAAVRRERPRALVLSATTSAMLASPTGLPYAVRLDAPASLNRPGARNAVLHALERRALARARLVLPWSQVARDALPRSAAPAVVVPPPVAASGPASGERDALAIAYCPDVKAKGLDVVCAAWGEAGVEGARLVVFGVEREQALAHLARTGVTEPPGVDFRGKRPAHEFRTELRRARVYVAGARWEDFGQVPLEALADGSLVATVPSAGPFEALRIARELAPELVAGAIEPSGLAAALRAAFAFPEGRLALYRSQAAERLAPYADEAIQERIEREVVPALLDG